MLDQLLETGPRQTKSAWGGVTSVVVHGVIIALAVYSTAVAAPPPSFVPDGPVIPVISPPSPVQPNTRRTGSKGGSRSPGNHLPPLALPAPTIDIDVATPVPAIGAAEGDDSLVAEIGRVGTAGADLVLGGAAPATEATLDVPVRVVDERTPVYPEMLRSAGITGTVRVQFVVDTAGRAELPSVRVLDSSHDLFARAVLASLRQARFTPGQLAGHRVRTLVERSYRFDIGGAR